MDSHKIYFENKILESWHNVYLNVHKFSRWILITDLFYFETQNRMDFHLNLIKATEKENHKNIS